MAESPKYKFIQTYSTARQHFKKGKPYDLDAATAAQLKRAGLIEEVEDAESDKPAKRRKA